MISFRERLVSVIKKIPGSHVLKEIPFLMHINKRMQDKYMDSRRENVQLNGYEIINKVYLLAKEIDKPIWIDWGTLLGFVREGAIIQHDYDLDFSTWRMSQEDYHVFRKKLIDNGFNLVREFTWDSTIITETYEYKDILVDFDYYEGDEKYAWTYSFDTSEQSEICNRNGIQYISGMDVYKFETSQLEIVLDKFQNGTVCYVPKDTERRAAEEYGNDWRIPKKDHNWKTLDNYEFCGFDSKMVGWRKK